jgi:hypothetical protein
LHFVAIGNWMMLLSDDDDDDDLVALFNKLN